MSDGSPVPVRVTSAVPISALLQKEVEQAVEQRLSQNQPYTITYEVKPKVIGGLKITLQGQVYDATVRGQLNHLLESTE